MTPGVSTPTGSTNYYSLYGRTIAMRQTPVGGPMTFRYLISNQLGSVTSVIDGTNYNTIIATTQYWPFGGARATTGGASPTDKLFTGQQKEAGDAALGLYNYKARFYSTVTGRFLSVDPIAGTPGDGDPVRTGVSERSARGACSLR